MLARTVCVLAATLAVTGVPAAAREVGLPLAHDAISPARSDGLATIAYLSAPGQLQVLGYRGRLRYAFDAGERCSTPPDLVALGGGQALLGCGNFDIALLDLRTRMLRAVPGAHQAILEAFQRTLGFGAFTDVGAYGVRFVETGYHEGRIVSVLDWRTGARTPAPETARSTLDLDRPDFTATLCPAVTRPRHATDPLSEEGPYDPVWGIYPFTVVHRRGVGLTITSCDSGRERVLWRDGRRRGVAAAVQLGAGLLSWVVPRTPDRIRLGVRLRGYLPYCGVGLSWRLAPYAQAAHVRTGLVVSEAAVPQGPWTIHRIPLGDVCGRTLQAWSLAVTDGRALTTVYPRAATLRLPRAGTIATSVVPRLPVRRTVHVRGVLRFQPGTAIVRSARGHLGDGSWRRAVRRGSLGWALSLPPVTGPRPLELEVRYRAGGLARYRLRVAPPSRPR